MGSLSDAYDNAMAVGFFSTLEAKLLSRRRFASQAEAKMACFSYIVSDAPEPFFVASLVLNFSHVGLRDSRPMSRQKLMNEGRFVGETVSRPGSERRREKRYEVELSGQIVGNSGAITVLLSDISASGALAVVSDDACALAAGETVDLVIDGFDTIRSRIAHVGHGFYGISFDNAHLHRQRLKAWLLSYVGEP